MVSRITSIALVSISGENLRTLEGCHKAISVSAVTGLIMIATAVTAPAGLAAERPSERIRVEINRVLQDSPSDEAIAGKSSAEVAAEAVRCAVLEGRTCCLQLGWVERAPSKEDLGRRIANENRLVDAGSGGDLPLASQVGQWARLPRQARMAADRAELDEAVRGLGKVKLYDLLLANKPVPADFWQKYPETSSWGKPLAERSSTSALALSDSIGDPAKGQKQSTSYWCGPTSMVAFGWNDPSRGSESNMRSQQHWATRLGTTTAGSAITTIASRINSDLTWDSLAGTYVVVSHLGWSVPTWRSLFQYKIPNGPIQLHPNLNVGNNKYNLNTSGHFNVGRAFNFNGADKFTQTVGIYEPAGGSAVPVSFYDTLDNIIRQNQAHEADNIAY